MNNEQRRDNYETQKGIAYLDEETRESKLTPKQRQRLRHKRNGDHTHDHEQDVFVDEKHRNVRVTHCAICRTSAPV